MLSVADLEIETIIHRLTPDISVLNKWFTNNGLVLNEDKCQFLIVQSSRAIKNEISTITFRKGRLLSITLDNNLTMADHIQKIASNKLHALARISKFLNDQQRIILMKSFVISQFNYCPISWMYCQRQSNNLINKIHERALRIAYNDYKSDFDNLLSRDDSVTIHQRNIQALAIEIHKSLNNLNPIFMKDIFIK